MILIDLVYVLVAAVTSPWWMRKARGGWRERFGHVAGMLKRLPGRRGERRGRIVLHTVSVGETAAVRTLVPMLAEHVDVIVAASTDTGLARAQALYGREHEVVRSPVDASWVVRRFLDVVQPDVMVLVELEVWPNMVAECRRRGIPVCVINGRLSEKSFRGYRRIRRLLRGTFGSLSFVCAQDEAYRERFVAMGVDGSRCVVTGSMKWDAVDVSRARSEESEKARAIATEMGIDRSRALIVAGSTAEGEEALLHEACPAGVQLMCAPRKPERFDDAAMAMPGCVRRSSGVVASGGDRFLLDTIGELSAAYELADVVVIGRSFVPMRGSDPTEPVALGKAVVVGPSMENFESIVDVLGAAGAVVRTTADDLRRELSRLIGDESERAELAKRGVSCVEREQGASGRHARKLMELVRGADVSAGG